MNKNENTLPSSPAAQLMAIEVISELLVSASPHKLGEALTEHLRELSGARTVMVLAHNSEPFFDELLNVSPERRSTLFSPAELNNFSHDVTPVELPVLTAELPVSHLLHAQLVRVGIQSMIRFPLNAGGELVGLLLLFDLPGVERIDETKYIINLLAAPIALALKNAIAFRRIEQLAQELEQRVEERTAELRDKNAELRQSEEKYRTLIQNISVGVVVHAPDTSIIFSNPMASTLLGLSKEQMRGKAAIDPAWCFIQENSTKMVPEEYPVNLVLSSGKPIANYVVGVCQADCSEPIWVQCNSYPVINEKGTLLQVVVTFSDITMHKRYEEQLVSLAQRLQLATSAAQLGVWDLDVRNNTMVWDNRMFELYGVTQKEFPSGVDAWMNGLHPEDREWAIAEYQEALSGEKNFDTVFRIVHPDGSVKYIKASGLVIRGADGTAERMIGVNSDITDAKISEQENAKLEGQLHQAQKMESVGRLAGGVAHDFNNMLTVILGHAQLGLMHLDSTHPVCADLQEICKSAEHSADLTRQLLAFARKQTVTPKVLVLNDVVAEMLKMLLRLIGEDIHLLWQPAPELWQVKIDPSQIDQILANLCVNARDAIEGTGRITIETENRTIDAQYCAVNPEATAGEYVRLSVSDNGGGMDKDTQMHIFEPFYTTKEVGKGTGLGLATVYGIVKQNSGFINVYSETGQGTTFSIYLPRHIGLNNRIMKEYASQEPMRGQETILLVEDEPAILNITAIMLETQGYNVLRAGTPGEAVQIARGAIGEIQLLMTDVIMPEMNGRDLAKNLLSIYPHMKRLFMSGYTADVIAHHGVLDDGVHFIQKPFSLSNMASKVREVLDGK